MRLNKRQILPILGAVLAGFVLQVITSNFNLSTLEFYLLSGVMIALIVCIGVPYALLDKEK